MKSSSIALPFLTAFIANQSLASSLQSPAGVTGSNTPVQSPSSSSGLASASTRVNDLRCATVALTMANACIGLDIDDSIRDWINCNSAALKRGDECPGIFTDECLISWRHINGFCQAVKESESSQNDNYDDMRIICVDASQQTLASCDAESSSEGDDSRDWRQKTEDFFRIFGLIALPSTALVLMGLGIYQGTAGMRARAAAVRQEQLAQQAIEMTHQRTNSLSEKWSERANHCTDEESGVAIDELRVTELQAQLQNLTLDRQLNLGSLMTKLNDRYENLGGQSGAPSAEMRREFANTVFRLMEAFIDDGYFQDTVALAMPINGVDYSTSQLTDARVDEILALLSFKEGAFPQADVWAARANSRVDSGEVISDDRVNNLKTNVQDSDISHKMIIGKLLSELDANYERLGSQHEASSTEEQSEFAILAFQLVEAYVEEDDIRMNIVYVMPNDNYIGYSNLLSEKTVDRLIALVKIKEEGVIADVALWGARAIGEAGDKSGRDMNEERITALAAKLPNLRMDRKILLTHLLFELDKKYEKLGGHGSGSSIEAQKNLANTVFRLLEYFLDDMEKIPRIIFDAMPVHEYIKSDEGPSDDLLDRVLFLVNAIEGELGGMPISNSPVDLEQRCPVTLCGINEEDEYDTERIEVAALYPKSKASNTTTENDEGVQSGDSVKPDLQYNLCDLWPFLKYYTKHGSSPSDRQPFSPDQLKLVSSAAVAEARKYAPKPVIEDGQNGVSPDL